MHLDESDGKGNQFFLNLSLCVCVSVFEAMLYRASLVLSWTAAVLTANVVGLHTGGFHFMSVDNTSTDGSSLQPHVLGDAPHVLGDAPKLEASSECAAITDCSCVLDVYTKLPKIDCNFLNLQTIPAFRTLDTVYDLIDLRSNRLSILQNNSFANLKVRKIDLRDNRELQSVELSAFKGQEVLLEELYISGGNNAPIPFASITRLTRLRRLVLQDLQQKGPDDLHNLALFPNLEALELTKIKNLNVNVMVLDGKLQKLQHLEVRECSLESIPAQILQQLTSLRALYIRQNIIQRVMRNSFEKLISLKNLDLSHNNMQLLDEEAFAQVSRTLTDLNLGSNNLDANSLSSLSSQRWPLLETLKLSYNDRLLYIDRTVFQNMNSLQYLSLDGISLSTVPSNLFQGLTQLISINLAYNNIRTIEPGAFSGISKNFELKLDYQFYYKKDAMKPLVLTPDAVKGLEDKLYYLNLEETAVVANKFWETMKTLTVIQEVLVKKTGLQTIPAHAFKNNKHLRIIDLRENNIQALDSNAFKGLNNSLTDIVLESNGITTVSECVFKNFTKLNIINLSNNPLHCDCKLLWLQKSLNKHTRIDNIYREQIICKSPTRLANRLLYKVPEQELVCDVPYVLDCSDQRISTAAPPTTTKGIPSDNRLKITVPSISTGSITVFWSLKNTNGITGYILEYYVPSNIRSAIKLNIHREDTFYVIQRLQSGTFYRVCVTAELNLIPDERLQDCMTVQTENGGSNSEGQTNNNNINDSIAESRQVMIGAIIAAVGVIVLVAVGICAVVKYRYKAKRLNPPLPIVPLHHHMCGSREDMISGGSYIGGVSAGSFCPNEYSEINPTQLAQYLAGSRSPRNLQRQFGFDTQLENSPYNSMNSHNHRQFRRRNPYENDNDIDVEGPPTEDEGVCFSNSEEILFKPELEERHSAPSRIAAHDTATPDNKDRNSRPLPATPLNQETEATPSRRSNTMQVRKGKNKRNNIPDIPPFKGGNDMDKQNT